MRKNIFFIIVVITFCLTSCSSVRYTKINFKNNTCKFNKGRWLVNYIDADVSDETKKELCNSFVYGLNTIRGCSAVGIYNAKLLDSKKVTSAYMLTEKDLKAPDFKNNFDYIMNVRVDFDGHRYSDYNLHTTSCSHTYTSGNHTHTHTYVRDQYLEDENLDINTVIEVVVYDLNTYKRCYTSGVQSDYSFMPTHVTTCDHENLTASITVGIFDAIISTPPSTGNKIKRLLLNSSHKILRDIKRQYRKSKNQ